MTIYKLKLNRAQRAVLVKDREVEYNGDESIHSPQDAIRILNTAFGAKTQAEEFAYLICMNTKNRILGLFELSHGTIDSTVLSPREVFVRTLLCNSKCILVAHNHPSGISTPSAEDVRTAKRLDDACEIMGVRLHDFIILTSRVNNYYSFYEVGEINSSKG